MLEPWTQEQIDKATELWLEGKSASFISTKVGKTRNAVIGKLHRIGVKRTDSKSKTAVSNKDQNATVLSEEKLKEEQKITLLALTEKTCRWPIGDPSTKNFWFCGKPVQLGKRYCTEHTDIALQSNPTKKDKSRPNIFNNSYTHSHTI